MAPEVVVEFFLDVIKFIKMNFSHLWVRLNHFYSCEVSGINYTKLLMIDILHR